MHPLFTRRFRGCSVVLGTVAALLLSGCIHFPHYSRLVTASALAAPAIVIHDVRLFRGTSTSAEEHMDVLIEDGRIAEIRAASNTAPSLPPGAQLIDGRGLTLLPGLIDLHAHLTIIATPPWYLALPQPEHNAEAHVYAGVTTLLDAGGDPDEIIALQKKIANHELVGPRIYFAGQHLTVPDGYPLNMIRDVYGRLAYWSLEGSHVRGVTSVAQLEGEVDRLQGIGASFIKLMIATVPPSGSPRLSEEMIAAAVKRAHGYGMRVLAHIDSASDALLCARLGVDLLAHGIEASALTDAEAKEIAASGIRVEPTLVNWERWDEIAAGHYLGSQLERESQPEEIFASFSDEELRNHQDAFASFASWGVELKTFQAQRTLNLMKLRAAGVPVLVGSDAQGSIGTFPGALHDELRLQVEAGIPAGEVLWEATGRAAQFLDPRADFGTIEVGKVADLLLVRGNPLENISATREISQVFVRGVPIERTAPKR